VLGNLDWRIALFVALSLTVVRMAPTAVALAGTRLRPRTVLFTGWFGPRGLASILFLVIIVEEAGPFDGLGRLNDVVAWTVVASIIAHGITAWPWSNTYADWIEREQAAGTQLAEMESPADIRTG
jgi:NhaP-type Na+/H+ or K+/H+ antiporter